MMSVLQWKMKSEDGQVYIVLAHVIDEFAK